MSFIDPVTVTPAKRKTFTLSFTVTKTLTVEQIWPDGDAPANPTASDVVDVIDDCGGALGVLRDWSLDDGMACVVYDGNDRAEST